MVSVEELPARPLSVDKFNDGCCYAIRNLRFRQTNIFLKVTTADEIYLKAPNERAFAYYRSRLFRGLAGPYAIRGPEGLELPDRFDEALEQFPDLRLPLSTGLSIDMAVEEEDVRAAIHYLVLHRLDIETLGKQPVSVARYR